MTHDKWNLLSQFQMKTLRVATTLGGKPKLDIFSVIVVTIDETYSLIFQHLVTQNQ